MTTLSTGEHVLASEIDRVRNFRKQAIDNGYSLLRVRTGSKKPLVQQWQQGEAEDQLLAVDRGALSTGLLTAGLRCVDIDVDTYDAAQQIVGAVCRHLPQGALIRRRSNSYRLAFIYRAADGQPGKRSVTGLHGKVEVLGAGQQVVVDGVHPAGDLYYFKNGRSPHTVPRDQLPKVTEEQIGAFLTDCAPLLGAIPQKPTTDVFLEPPTSQASIMARAAGPVPNELGAGIQTPNWFETLGAEEKSVLVQQCLDAIDNRTDDPRDRWLRILFAVADAERSGCLDAHDLALEWSRRGASWTSEADFETAWRSCKPGGISVGSLLAAGKEAGVDLSACRDTALVRLQPAAGVVPLGTAAPTASGPLQHRRSLPVSALPAVPEKRQWLHGTDALRGAVTLFVAPGGRGKSTWLIGLALACASGRELLGTHIFGGPLRVLVLSAEDPTAEVTRRIRAAMQHHGLSNQDVAGLHIIGANDWGLSLLQAVGNTPALDKRGWDALNAELDHVEPDVLILDPLMSLMGGVDGNNNSAAAVLMGGLVKLAAERRMAVIVAHHAAKGRDPASAESAMGAASFVNFSRVGLSIEPLQEKDAARIGVAPWDAQSFFRVTGVKHNFSPPDANERWFRYVTVELPNKQPPIYTKGDKIAVVELFKPGVSGSAYPAAMIGDALKAIDSANPPLSPSKRATGRYAVHVIAQAIAHHRGGKVSDVEAEGVLGHIQYAGLAAVQSVKVPRPGKGADGRNGLVVTPAGKAAMHAADPAGVASTKPPQSPQSSRGDDAGHGDSGSPKGPRNVPGGCGGNAGAEIAGKSTLPSNNDTSKVESKDSGAILGGEGPEPPLSSSDAPAPISAATSPDPIEPIRPSIAETVTQPIAPASTPSTAPTTVDTQVTAPPITPAVTDPDDLEIPAFLRRPLPGSAARETAPGPDSSVGSDQQTALASYSNSQRTRDR